MSINTYSGLVTAISDWLDRTVTEAQASSFIQLTEARLNRLLEDPEMEVTSNSFATGDYTALPADFGSMVSISTGNGPLRQVGAVEFAGYNTIGGIPRHYVVTDGSISFAPNNTTTPIRMVYRRRIPALSLTAPTNWLLTLAPDAYLYGSLMQAESFDMNDERLAGWKAMFDETIAELRQDASRRKWGAGALAPRIGRT